MFSRTRFIGTCALIVALGGLNVVFSEFASKNSWNRQPRRRHRKISRQAGLIPGRWLPENHLALERLLNERGKGVVGYSELEPPVAVFSMEDVLVAGDIGETVFRRLVNRVEFKIDRTFWELVPLHYGRERIRAGYTDLPRQMPRIWPKDPYYQMYRKAFFQCHQELCRQEGFAVCARWRASLLSGFEQKELRRYAGEAIQEALVGPWGMESIRDFSENPDPVQIRVGLRKIPEFEYLIQKLLDRGFDVWVLSTSHQEVAELSAQLYGVHPTRVVGIKSRMADGKLTPQLAPPVPYGLGKVEAVKMFIGRSPALVVGGASDEPLLKYGRDLRLWVADASKPQTEAARKQGWLVQPVFMVK